MADSSSLLAAFEQLYVQLGVTDLVSRDDLHRVFKVFEAKLMAIAFEVNLALTIDTPLHRAVHDDVSFPHLYRAHRIVGDILDMSVPPELQAWARRAVEMPLPPLADVVLARLAYEAAGPASPQSFGARFILFEATRMTLRVAARRTHGTFEAVGASELDIDEISERQVANLIADEPQRPSDVRPVHLLFASAMVELTDVVEELRAQLRSFGAGLVDQLREAAAIQHRLRDLDPVEGALVDNALADYMGRQRVSLERLQKEHPLLLGPISRAALDQRASRLRRRLLEHGKRLPSRRFPSLTDVLETLDGELA